MLSPTGMRIFTRDVHLVTEWKDGCVWKTEKVGQVACLMSACPFRPGSHATLVVPR